MRMNWNQLNKLGGKKNEPSSLMSFCLKKATFSTKSLLNRFFKFSGRELEAKTAWICPSSTRPSNNRRLMSLPSSCSNWRPNNKKKQILKVISRFYSSCCLIYLFGSFGVDLERFAIGLENGVGYSGLFSMIERLDQSLMQEIFARRLFDCYLFKFTINSIISSGLFEP